MPHTSALDQVRGAGNDGSDSAIRGHCFEDTVFYGHRCTRLLAISEPIIAAYYNF